ncbi:hypothetical protein Tco_0599819 [Tanacetum coccineum]
MITTNSRIEGKKPSGLMLPPIGIGRFSLIEERTRADTRQSGNGAASGEGVERAESTIIVLSPDLAHIDLIPPGIVDTDFDPKEEIRLIEELLYDNSLLDLRKNLILKFLML